jgi:hypothetical protein
MRFAIMTAAGSRSRDTGIWRDLGVRTVARLAGFPTIISPISTIGPRPPKAANSIPSQIVFNLAGEIDSCIVNNLERGYHLKKRGTNKHADASLSRPHQGETA